MLILLLLFIILCLSIYCIYLHICKRNESQKVVDLNQKTEAKSNFIATMAHEIRTPLNGISLAANLLKDEKDENKLIDLVDMINNSSNLLINVVNDILDFSKIEAGKLELDYQRIKLKKIVRDIIFSFEHQFKDKGLFIHYNIDSQLAELIYSDEVRLKQVLYNLIGNAYKFTDNGGVSITISKKDEFIEFAVKDTGIGLTSEQQEKLFKAYTQADNTTQTKFGGTGLGLNISLKLVELLGGEIGVESAKGEGSTFKFTIKNNPVPNISVNIIEDTEEDINFSKLDILVADDNPMNRKVAELALKKFELNPDFAIDGNEVVQKAKDKNYDIILMDLHMPVMSGIEATEELITNIPFSELPVIYAFSANAFKETKDSCFNAGMNGFIAKPLNLENLKEPLKAALKRKQQKEKS